MTETVAEFYAYADHLAFVAWVRLLFFIPAIGGAAYLLFWPKDEGDEG